MTTKKNKRRVYVIWYETDHGRRRYVTEDSFNFTVTKSRAQRFTREEAESRIAEIGSGRLRYGKHYEKAI